MDGVAPAGDVASKPLAAGAADPRKECTAAEMMAEREVLFQWMENRPNELRAEWGIAP